MIYQDNQLADQDAADGHEVVVISDCCRYSGNALEKVGKKLFFLRIQAGEDEI